MTISQKRSSIIEIVPKLPATARESVFRKLEQYPWTYNANAYIFNLKEIPNDLIEDIFNYVTLENLVQEREQAMSKDTDQTELQETPSDDEETSEMEENEDFPRMSRKVVDEDDEETPKSKRKASEKDDEEPPKPKRKASEKDDANCSKSKKKVIEEDDVDPHADLCSNKPNGKDKFKIWLEKSRAKAKNKTGHLKKVGK